MENGASAASGRAYALGCKTVDAPRWLAPDALVVPTPVHTAMFLENELLRLGIPCAQIIAAADHLADTQQHPLLPMRKHFGQEMSSPIVTPCN